MDLIKAEGATLNQAIQIVKQNPALLIHAPKGWWDNGELQLAALRGGATLRSFDSMGIKIEDPNVGIVAIESAIKDDRLYDLINGPVDTFCMEEVLEWCVQNCPDAYRYLPESVRSDEGWTLRFVEKVPDLAQFSNVFVIKQMYALTQVNESLKVKLDTIARECEQAKIKVATLKRRLDDCEDETQQGTRETKRIKQLLVMQAEEKKRAEEDEEKKRAEEDEDSDDEEDEDSDDEEDEDSDDEEEIDSPDPQKPSYDVARVAMGLVAAACWAFTGKGPI